jgi:hypothetical protein
MKKSHLHEHFLSKFRAIGRNFGSYMRITTMDDAQGSYSNEEEFKGLHDRIGNAKAKSNGRRDRKDPVTVRSEKL